MYVLEKLYSFLLVLRAEIDLRIIGCHHSYLLSLTCWASSSHSFWWWRLCPAANYHALAYWIRFTYAWWAPFTFYISDWSISMRRPHTNQPSDTHWLVFWCTCLVPVYTMRLWSQLTNLQNHVQSAIGSFTKTTHDGFVCLCAHLTIWGKLQLRPMPHKPSIQSLGHCAHFM